ncbi:MAG: SDR family oxidoreductase [Oscillospiraceae bacterium]|nr:SDR family oxidoreductase [Oscillospiraceae bacterium]
MKHVLITGGSRGIGRAAVELFCREGYEVSFFYHSAQEAAEQLARDCGARALCCDVADGQQVSQTIAQLPPVDILINNAGISHYGLISQISSEEWDRLFAVNVKSIYHCVNAVLPAMLQKQQGCILNMASMWGQVGASCEAAYSATKGAVIALTKALAQELGPSGIRVNCVSPGVILTDMLGKLSQETLRDLAEDSPLGRNGQPEDVAQALLYLAEAPFVTGQNLAVNGGFVLS